MIHKRQYGKEHTHFAYKGFWKMSDRAVPRANCTDAEFDVEHATAACVTGRCDTQLGPMSGRQQGNMRIEKKGSFEKKGRFNGHDNIMCVCTPRRPALKT